MQEPIKNRRNYYRILHVQPDAPREVIRSSYRTMMQRLRMHPDLGGDDYTAAVLNEAYATLTDPEHRDAYDRSRRSETRAAAARKLTEKKLGDPAKAIRRCAFCTAANEIDGENTATPFCRNCQSPLAPAAHLQSEGQDRRAINRIPKVQSMVFCTHWPQSDPVAARTEDISLNGLKFESDAALLPGQIIKINAKILQAVARVTNARKRGSRWCIGVSFVSLYFEQPRGSFVSGRV